MPFTAQEIENIANATLDFYVKGNPILQTIQERPLVKALTGKQKNFSGGNGLIRKNVKGDYTVNLSGFSHDDTVGYSNPANIKQTNFPWRELHGGISLTMTELKHDGITIVDSQDGKNVTEKSDREIHAISNLMDDKLEDMKEGVQRSFNEICWRDGTQSAKVFAGIQSIITPTPTTGVVGGIDAASVSWWRNRTATATSSGSLQTATKMLRSEARQLRRYGGRPSLVLCGSLALERLETEIHEKGTYTQEGFMKKTDLGSPEISMRGVGDFMYDPTLDDLGLSNYIYLIDPRHLYLMVMDGEEWKTHSPARPPEKYVLYRSITWTGGMVCDRRNVHGVYIIN